MSSRESASALDQNLLDVVFQVTRRIVNQTSIAEINIGVFNPTGVESLMARPDCNVLVFWIQTNDKIRLLRQLNREEDPDVREVVRRFQADYNDFEDIDFSYIGLINNTPGDLEDNVKEILVQSGRRFARGQK